MQRGRSGFGRSEGSDARKGMKAKIGRQEMREGQQARKEGRKGQRQGLKGETMQGRGREGRGDGERIAYQ